MTEAQHAQAGRKDKSEPILDQDLGYTLQDLVLDSPDVGEFLTNVAVLAAAELSTPSNPVMCGVTVVRRKRGTAVASSNPKAGAMDRLQNSFGDGPCLTALHAGSTILVPDTGLEARWPDYMDAVQRNGIGSILAVALDLGGEAEAVLNLYSPSTHGFPAQNITAAEVFAEHASTSLRLALRIAHLHHVQEDLSSAMESRTTIDTAVGIIMAQNRCSREAAFSILTNASNHRNIKIRDVATSVVASVSGEQTTRTHFDE